MEGPASKSYAGYMVRTAHQSHHPRLNYDTKNESIHRHRRQRTKLAIGVMEELHFVEVGKSQSVKSILGTMALIGQPKKYASFPEI